jgi:CheY-like chemotaxis protein
MLLELGHGVLEAADGRRAMEPLRVHRNVDLLFTDIGLPGGVNGRQLSDQAQQLRPKSEVLFTAGYARNAIVHQVRPDPVNLQTVHVRSAGGQDPACSQRLVMGTGIQNLHQRLNLNNAASGS